MPAELSTEALVLRRFDTGEADRVVWLLTPGRGRLAAFAPGARKSKRRFAGALEPFARLAVQLSPPTRGELWRLADAQVLEPRPRLTDSLEAVACASAATELVIALAPEGSGDESTRPRTRSGHYELLVAYLRRLSEPPPRDDDLYRFLILSLEVAGVRPRLLACARCGRTEPTLVEAFDAAEGGRLCGSCPPRGPGARRLLPALLSALQAFEAGRGACPFEGRALLWDYAQHHAGKPLKSLELLFELGL